MKKFQAHIHQQQINYFNMAYFIDLKLSDKSNIKDFLKYCFDKGVIFENGSEFEDDSIGYIGFKKYCIFYTGSFGDSEMSGLPELLLLPSNRDFALSLADEININNLKTKNGLF